MIPWTRFLSGALVLALAASRVVAQPALPASKPEVKTAIVAAIEGQLGAFRKGDAAKAYSFAARELRAQKPLRTFTAIVRESYPEIWANVRAEFGIVRDDGTKATVTVQVFAKDAEAGYDYTLVKETAGWRIYGVVRHEGKRRNSA